MNTFVPHHNLPVLSRTLSSFHSDWCVSRGEKSNVRISGGRRQCRDLPSHYRWPFRQQKAQEQDDNSQSWHFGGETSPWVFTVQFTTLQNTTHSQKPNYKRFQVSTFIQFLPLKTSCSHQNEYLKEADYHRESLCHFLERAQLTNMTTQQTVSG